MSIYNYYLTIIFLMNSFKISLLLPQLKVVFKETDSCECGKANDPIETRIVRGEVVINNTYPWMTAIFLNGSLHCGGSVINDRYILTAGHCLNRINKHHLKVLLGATDLHLAAVENQKDSSEVEIEWTTIHEDFTNHCFYDTEDIGLIKLKYPIKFSNRITPICLPKSDTNDDSKMVFVAGWGRTEQDNMSSRFLRKANLKLMTNKDCRYLTNLGDYITDSMICAYQSKKDACQGDSGGPLVLENGDKMEQVGIISWGIGCAKPETPGVYTRMTSYLDWISRRTQDAIYCKNK